ncbi:MAG: ATP synthase F1 subunit delta [Planctomycetes bacterium]|nr:ATP synthase F1 subunit delta [Planctomycetota bacterium]MCH8210542.1 ATP synthase F1 subunit delta [Planctomycetota bacterium]MCH8259109.1 ATP synthase F1 subunit delta [Planctomycetota bacterium]
MAIHTDAIAKVYAKSLYELADDAGGRDKIVELAEELEQICELARGDRTFREFLASPIINTKARGEAIRRIFHGRVTDLALRFLLVLNNKARLRRLESISAAFDQLVHEALGRIEVDIYTPGPLGPEQLDTIKQRIQAALGKDPVLYSYTDAAMIGGVRLRIGDQLIDGSVASRLRRLRQHLLTSGSSAVRQRLDRIIEEGAEG